MKHILITTIAAVVLVGCGESQQSAPAPETKLRSATPGQLGAPHTQPRNPTIESG